MDANQIEKLKALALAAPEYSIYQILDGISNDEYLSFIAEANPAAVLELIAEVERLRAAPATGTVEKDAAECVWLPEFHECIEFNGKGNAAIAANTKAGKANA